MMFRKKVIRENMDNNSFTLKNFKVMTAFNTSFFSSSADAASRVGKKGYRSSKSNNSYIVDVYDFDNEVSRFDVEASSPSEASEQAESLAMSQGVQVSYCNVYCEQ